MCNVVFDVVFLWI